MKKLVGFTSVVGIVATTAVVMSGCSSSSSSSSDTDAGTDAGTPVVSQCTTPTGAPITHTGEVKADETWSADSVHLVPNDFNVLANVTIAPCAQVQIGASVTITVGAGASIKGEGTASQAITIGAQDPSKPWSTIRTIGGFVRLAYATVSDGGQPASNAVPNTVGAFFGQTSTNTGAVTTAYSFDNVTIQGSHSDGIVLSGVDIDAASTALTITGAAQFPVRIGGAEMGSVPSGKYSGNGTDAILVMGGVNETIKTNITIHDPGVPYQIGDGTGGADLRISSGTSTVATVTIDPNVTLAFKKGGALYVEFADTSKPATGALVAKGADKQPVTFTSAESPKAPGDWVGVAFNSIPDAHDALDHVVIDYAGADADAIEGCPLNTEVKGALLLVGEAPASGFLTSSTISNSARDGVFRGWIGADIDFDATNTFTNVPNCHETNVLISQGTCPTTACPQ
jgi:hypothetical protein